MTLVKGLTTFMIVFLFGACATASGSRQIQSKCKHVDDLSETYVCEQP